MLGNGDIQRPGDIVSRVRETGVDGVLVGRAALGAPWFFTRRNRCGSTRVNRLRLETRRILTLRCRRKSVSLC
ncbi:MAG: hypothetical protein HC938_08200 [Nitrospira sp.]|nr:hypothetical protein [Nitrospira sp.]